MDISETISNPPHPCTSPKASREMRSLSYGTIIPAPTTYTKNSMVFRVAIYMLHKSTDKLFHERQGLVHVKCSYQFICRF
jgi:hypothetical protein